MCYKWGEIEESVFTGNYEYSYGTFIDDKDGIKYIPNIDLGDDIAGTQYDVAHVKWGDGWQMPTYEQMFELEYTLRDLVTKETIRTIDGSLFLKVTSINGGTIIFPGGLVNEYTESDCESYWSSTQQVAEWRGWADTLSVYADYGIIKTGACIPLFASLFVRPVKKP